MKLGWRMSIENCYGSSGTIGCHRKHVTGGVLVPNRDVLVRRISCSSNNSQYNAHTRMFHTELRFSYAFFEYSHSSCLLWLLLVTFYTFPDKRGACTIFFVYARSFALSHDLFVLNYEAYAHPVWFISARRVLLQRWSLYSIRKIFTRYTLTRTLVTNTRGYSG